ncbi:MAG: amino acid permease [Candidatus Dactylopiibacterium carminicum]|nr:MAG: amino acid permease [Candidatus Dactylopiibacterium carminicum]
MPALPDSSTPDQHAAHPHAVLDLHVVIAIIVGIVVGAGIFKTPGMVAGLTGDSSWMFFAWLFGGIISLVGALCYAELASAYPNAGGDYHFLTRAFGRSLGLLFAWARFTVITTGSIALLAFVFGDYLAAMLPVDALGPTLTSALYAALAVLVLSGVHLAGIRSVARAQVWLTVVQIVGLLLVVLAAFSIATPVSVPEVVAESPASGPSASAFGLAMVFVLLTYGGWNEAAYVSAEIKQPKRNIVRALMYSILLITALYLLVNWAYWRVLGTAGMAQSQAIAADLLAMAFGPVGGTLISLLVMVTALTTVNATMIVGARTGYAVGRDWPQLAGLGQWSPDRQVPANALWVQCVAALLLIAVGAVTGGGFRAMVEFTSPVFWLFFLLSGVALLVLRQRDPATERPFRVPLYPVLPLLLCAVCAYMLWSSLSFVYSQSLGGFNAAWIGVVVLLVGLLLVLCMRPSLQASYSRS